MVAMHEAVRLQSSCMFEAGGRFDHKFFYFMKGDTYYEENRRPGSGCVPVPRSGYGCFR